MSTAVEFLRQEIARVEALDADDRAVCDCLQKAKALVARIEAAAAHDDRAE